MPSFGHKMMQQYLKPTIKHDLIHISVCSHILSMAITYSCLVAARHLLNGPHTDVYRSISKGQVHLNTWHTDSMWYEYQQASMYRKHSRSLQSAKNRKIFALKNFILPHCLDTATPPRPNERDPNSRAVKMHRKEEKKGRERRKNLGS